MKARLTLLLLALGVAGAAAAKPVDLSGAWQFRLDPKDKGLAMGWTTNALPDRIHLPTTTDLAGFGAPEPDPNPGFLSREHKSIGAAWYQREIAVPEAWRGREVELFLERALWESRAWVDGRACDAQDSLGAPHVHTLGRLSPGRRDDWLPRPHARSSGAKEFSCQETHSKSD